MKTKTTESDLNTAIAHGLSLGRKAAAGVAITADEHKLASLALELSRTRSSETELFPSDQTEVESPRLAWLKKHGITTRECVLAGVPAEAHWSALFTHYENYYPRYNGATEDEALAKLAIAHGFKLWNEEGL